MDASFIALALLCKAGLTYSFIVELQCYCEMFTYSCQWLFCYSPYIDFMQGLVVWDESDELSSVQCLLNFKTPILGAHLNVRDASTSPRSYHYKPY